MRRMQMLFRTVCRFSGTEDAQKAAGTIKKKTEDIYEIKMRYRSVVRENSILSEGLNVVCYSGKETGGYPKENGNSLFYGSFGNSFGIPQSEYSKECELSVLSSAESAEKVRTVVINCGGFGVTVYAEPDREF